MKFKTGDIVVLDEPMLELVMVNNIDRDCYNITMLDTEQMLPRLGRERCWLISYVDKVGMLLEPNVEQPAKCICPIRDLCSIGCKCGGI